MFTINTVTVSGRLGQDPESIADGKGCRFSLAVEERFKQGDDWTSRTNWIPITGWGSVAEQMRKQLAKGTLVAITGNLREETWEKDGQKRSKVGVVVRAFFYPGKGDGESNGSTGGDVPADTTGLGQTAAAGVNDDIPFN